MAALPESDRLKIWRGLMRYWSNQREPTAFTKTDLKTAIDDLDLWIDTNAAVINAVLPQPFRGSATVEQKAVLFSALVAMRFTEAWLKRLVGEVS